MRKINQAKEKRERNKLYAKKFEKSYDGKNEERKKAKKLKAQGGLYGRWCRIKGHPFDCDCVYPKDVVPSSGRNR